MNSTQKNIASVLVHNIFIFLVIGIFAWLSFSMMLPFLSTLFMAAVVSIMTYPLVKYLISKKKFSRNLSVFIVFLGVVLLIVIPFTVIIYSLVGEATSVASLVLNQSWSFQNYVDEFFNIFPFIETYFPTLKEKIDLQSAENFISNWATVASGTMIQSATTAVKHLSMIILHTIIFLFALFYFLLDGTKVLSYVRRLLPLSKLQITNLYAKIEDLMISIVHGIFGASIAQGFLLGVGLAIAGIPNPIFWGTVATFLAPIPFIGTAMIWIPVSIYLFSNGQFGAGVFFMSWCLLLVINIDNIIKPYLIGSRTMLHPFAVMLMILGGVITFGFKGLIFGPLILTLLIAFLHIYELEHMNENIKD